MVLSAVIDVKWHGDAVIELIFKDISGRVASELVLRE